MPSKTVLCVIRFY